MAARFTLLVIVRSFPLLLLTIALHAHAAQPRPLVPLYDAPALTKGCDDHLAAARRMIAAMEAKRGAGAIFDEWNRLSIVVEDGIGPANLLGEVHPDKA